jgi:multisubunit Na+/H+ antiporter MnhB subunit
MNAEEIQQRAAMAVRKLADFRALLRKSPGLALLTAVAVGFAVGLVLRGFERKPVERTEGD